MRSRSSCYIGAAVLVSFFATAVLFAGDLPGEERRFAFTYEVRLPSIPEGAKSVDLWVPLPPSTRVQKISRLEISSNLAYSKTRESRFGNEMIYAHADGGKAEPLRLRLSFVVERRTVLGEKDYEQPPEDREEAYLERFLEPDELVPTDGVIRETALRIVRDGMTPLEKARALYEYVAHTLHYDKSGEGWGRGDALYACSARRGNCTDFHSLFIGMARACGIPARFLIGFPIPAEARGGEIPGYHCWAEFYVQGKGWVPVDISEAAKHPEKRDFLFGGLDADRVQFSEGRDIRLEPPLTRKALNYFIYPFVLVDGSPYHGYSTKFTFEDLRNAAKEG